MNEKLDAATAARELTLALLFLNRFREKVGQTSVIYKGRKEEL